MIFTVDLEWAHHALELPEAWPPSFMINEQENIVYRLLHALERHNVKALWYVLGHVAATHPKLVCAIQHAGHQIGNHGYWHRPQEREKDASYHKAANAIFTALEGQVSGPYPYRSPFWDTTPRPGWSGGKAFRMLPRWALLRELRRTGVFWIHPHDLRTHIRWNEPWHRHIQVDAPWRRLEWLLTTVKFDAP